LVIFAGRVVVDAVRAGPFDPGQGTLPALLPGLSGAMLLLLGCPALLFLVFLGGFALLLGQLLGRFLLLLGGFAGFAAIFSDASVFALSVSGYRPCQT
jgi:hypothetical protein